MNNLIEVLEDNIKKIIVIEKTVQLGTLSGSNALLFDGLIFEAENSDNCPRIAMLRRVGNIQSTRSVKDYISNSHGRLFENLLKSILSVNIEFLEEEEVEVFIEDNRGNKLLSARPDKIFKYENKLYPLETKTIQSNSTAYQVFIKEKPKLGGLIQLAIFMYGHNLEKGFLLYCASNWFGGFAGKTQWKVEPSFKLFEVTLNKEDNHFYYNGVKSIITVEKILNGCYEFLKCKKENVLPVRPNWVNAEGGAAKYDGCGYCNYKDLCDSFSGNLNEFFYQARSVNEDTGH